MTVSNTSRLWLDDVHVLLVTGSTSRGEMAMTERGFMRFPGGIGAGTRRLCATCNGGGPARRAGLTDEGSI